MIKRLECAEKVFAVVSLLHYSGGPLVVLLAGGVSEGEASTGDFNAIPVRILYLLNYFISFLLITARWKKVIYLISKDKFIGILIAIAVMSVFWSYDPNITISRVIALIGTTLFGVYLASRYTLKQQIQLLGWTFGLAILLSLLFIVALPKYGIMGGVHAGAWRGIYPHKNSCGPMMMLSSIIFLFLAISEKKKRLRLWLGLALSVFILLMTRSTSALLNLINLLNVFFVFRALRLRIDWKVPILCLIITVSSSLFIIIKTDPELILGAFGKSSNLSGRDEIWAAVLDIIWKRPWLGYGYGAFWLGENSEAINIWYAVGWKVPYAHNGWLEMWLDLGFLALIISAFGFMFSFLRSVYLVCITTTTEMFWPGIYIVYMFLANISESLLMVQNGFSWVLYVTICLSILLPPEKPVKT
ncbi:MAG TPA: O-antigen ligase [Nodularia sp. (in: cyanobacteria)]|nr:O-antigen ligase [Nodularia sp. (in: cyanobacteria)]